MKHRKKISRRGRRDAEAAAAEERELQAMREASEADIQFTDPFGQRIDFLKQLNPGKVDVGERIHSFADMAERFQRGEDDVSRADFKRVGGDLLDYLSGRFAQEAAGLGDYAKKQAPAAVSFLIDDLLSMDDQRRESSKGSSSAEVDSKAQVTGESKGSRRPVVYAESKTEPQGQSVDSSVREGFLKRLQAARGTNGEMTAESHQILREMRSFVGSKKPAADFRTSVNRDSGQNTGHSSP